MFCRITDLAFAHSVFIENAHFDPPAAFQEGPLGPGGDGETVQCLKLINFINPLVCADIQLVVTFSIETQPKKKMEKDFRFATRKTTSGMTWNVQPIYAPMDYCSTAMQQ